mmetsp:Transcript_9324/g.18796  ORF Transcript_9324/g.18796 Transcript_9324/m.18796 type:complete len:283 (-) Transcript_9324:1357-2205(-)
MQPQKILKQRSSIVVSVTKRRAVPSNLQGIIGLGPFDQGFKELRLDRTDVETVTGSKPVERTRCCHSVRAHIIKIEPVSNFELRQKDGTSNDIDRVACGTKEGRGKKFSAGFFLAMAKGGRLQRHHAVFIFRGVDLFRRTQDTRSDRGVIKHDIVEGTVNTIIDVVGVVILEGRRVAHGLHNNTIDSSLTSSCERKQSRGLVTFFTTIFGTGPFDERVRHTFDCMVRAILLLFEGRSQKVGRRFESFLVKVQLVSVDVDLLLHQLLRSKELGIVGELFLDAG